MLKAVLRHIATDAELTAFTNLFANEFFKE